MTREKTGNDILDKLYKEHDELKEKVIQMSNELGWCDENGDFEILEKDTENMLTELEKKRLESKEDIQKEAETVKMTIQMNRIGRRIKEMEQNIKNAEE